MPRHVRRHSAVSCAKMAEPIDLLFGLWTRVHGAEGSTSSIVFTNLAIRNEPSVYGGDEALCQITLTTCYYYFKFNCSIRLGQFETKYLDAMAKHGNVSQKVST